MKLLVAYNTKKENTAETLKSLTEVLNREGILYELMEVSFGADFDKKKVENSNIVVVIGGDGTIIHIAKTAAEFGIPVLGINNGRVGFLAGLETTELEKITELISGNYTVSDRMMLEVEAEGKKYLCLNDAVISKGALSRIIDISATFGGNTLFYRVDGIIVSTPTGSTAYSMSAGGPVVDPKIKCMVISPVCSHSIFSRSLVISDNDTVFIEAGNPNQTEICLTIDGEQVIALKQDSVVSIKKAKTSAKLITIGRELFFDKLSNKLK